MPDLKFCACVLLVLHRSVKGAQKKDAARAQKGKAAASAAKAKEEEEKEAEAAGGQDDDEEEEEGLEAYERGPRRAAKVSPDLLGGGPLR